MNKSKLLEALARCAAACRYCATACLGEEDVKMMAQCIRLDLDCADICSTAAAFVARDSAHASHLLRECAEICEQCAAECGRHEAGHCQECAEACRECAELCKAA